MSAQEKTYVRTIVQDVVQLLDQTERDDLHNGLSEVGNTTLLPDQELVVH